MKDIQNLKEDPKQPEPAKEKESELKPNEKKVSPVAEHSAPKKEPSAESQLPAEPAPTPGARSERRVCLSLRDFKNQLIVLGQNESHAFTDRRAIEGISEHCGIFDNFQ